MENKNFFSVKCSLLAFFIEVLGPAVLLELQRVDRAFVASYYAYHIHTCPLQFLGDAVALLRKS